MDVYKIHSDSLRSLQDENENCPAMFYNGDLIRILPGGASYRTQNSPGGLSINADLSLTVLVADFPENFDFNSMTNQTFNYPNEGGQAYSVDSVVKSPNQYQVRILANSNAEGL